MNDDDDGLDVAIERPEELVWTDILDEKGPEADDVLDWLASRDEEELDVVPEPADEL